MGAIDRSRKHMIERMVKMVPSLMVTSECRHGKHDLCPRVRGVPTGGDLEMEKIEDGWKANPDTIEAPCGCECHE